MFFVGPIQRFPIGTFPFDQHFDPHRSDLGFVSWATRFWQKLMDFIHLGVPCVCLLAKIPFARKLGMFTKDPPVPSKCTAWTSDKSGVHHAIGP